MKTTKTDEAKSEDDLEEEYKNMLKVSFIVVAFESSSFVKARLSFYYSRVLFLLCRAIKDEGNTNYLGFQCISQKILTRSMIRRTKARRATTRKKERQQPAWCVLSLK